jgi:hypothetical protein
MLVTLQFPIADLRPFVPGETHRLVTPAWPNPRADVDFIRLFGPVRNRHRGGVAEWPGEHIFCNATHAIRFDAKFSVGGLLGITGRKCAFRRFFSDGRGTSRIEVGIAFRPRNDWTLKSFLGVLHDTLKLPVTVGRGPEAATPNLFRAESALAKLVLRASTHTKTNPDFKPQSWWVTPGKPTLLIEYDTERENLPQPPGFKAIENQTTFGMKVRFGRMNFFGRTVGVWLIGSSSRISADRLRRFRIHLLRLHAQREVVTEVLRAIEEQHLKPERTTPADPPEHPSNRLQEFLAETIERMERKTYEGMAQSDLLSAAMEIQDSVSKDERTVILEQLEPLRKAVREAVDRFTAATGFEGTVVIVEAGGTYVEQKQNVTITGGTNVSVNQVAAKTIQNSFNSIQQSNASDEMKARLTELNELVQQLMPKLPEDQQKKAAKNLDKLTEEATSKEPDREWYEVSAKGLIDAAKTVAEMAGPVTTAVKAVLALLI